MNVAGELAAVAQRVFADAGSQTTVRRPVVRDQAELSMPRPPGGPWIAVKEYAARTSVHHSTVYRWIREGTLDATTLTVGKRRWLLIYDNVEHDDENARKRLPGGAWDSVSTAA